MNNWGDDYYTQRAKSENLRARSYFKLEEIQQKYPLFKTGQKILDLGAAPGSWSLYVLKQIGSSGHAIGIDLSPIEEISAKNYEFRQGDAFDLKATDFDTPFDGIISDMAPKTTGIHQVDSAASSALVEKSIYLAIDLLKDNGFFIAKYLQGAEFQELQQLLRQNFKKVRQFKPKSSRSASTEMFFIAEK